MRKAAYKELQRIMTAARRHGTTKRKRDHPVIKLTEKVNTRVKRHSNGWLSPTKATVELAAARLHDMQSKPCQRAAVDRGWMSKYEEGKLVGHRRPSAKEFFTGQAGYAMNTNDLPKIELT